MHGFAGHRFRHPELRCAEDGSRPLSVDDWLEWIDFFFLLSLALPGFGARSLFVLDSTLYTSANAHVLVEHSSDCLLSNIVQAASL